MAYDPARPLSWSAISSFEWNREQWWKKYVGGEIPEKTPELEFGSYVDQRIQDDPTFLPELERYPIQQHKMECAWSEIPLIGIADHYDRGRLRLKDDKTGRKKWDQKRADETGQLTMYALMLYLTEGIMPKEMEFRIDWMPTHIQDGKIAFIKEGDVRTFRTRRSMHDILVFGQRIVDTYIAMGEYAKHRPVLDTCDWDEWNKK